MRIDRTVNNYIKKNLSTFEYKVYPIGKSFFNRKIICIEKKPKTSLYFTTLVVASIHAREWATSLLTLDLLSNYIGNNKICLIPLLNIDGVKLCTEGIKSIPKYYRDYLININNSKDFLMWKANGRGVDLNVNYPYRWGEGINNSKIVSRENYIGKCPLSEPENIALTNYIDIIKPDYLVSYHAKGEEIYYGCDNQLNNRDDYIDFEKITGYKIKTSEGSYGGLKEWFISRYNKPAITIEIGTNEDKYDKLYLNLDRIFEENRNILYEIDKKYAKKVHENGYKTSIKSWDFR